MKSQYSVSSNQTHQATLTFEALLLLKEFCLVVFLDLKSLVPQRADRTDAEGRNVPETNGNGGRAQNARGELAQLSVSPSRERHDHFRLGHRFDLLLHPTHLWRYE